MNIEVITTKLREFYSKHHRLPTHGEMVKLLHYTSRGSTYYVVKRLLEEGILIRDEQGKLIPKTLLSIPMLGIIKAGYPMPAEVQKDSYLNLHLLFSNLSSTTFALTVSGDSMIDEGIYENDIVIIEKNKTPKTGDIVAACVDGEWTVKYLQKKGNVVSLHPANKKYPVIYPTESLEIGGVVMHVLRNYK
jgi:SOS regulatory protein LexA